MAYSCCRILTKKGGGSDCQSEEQQDLVCFSKSLWLKFHYSLWPLKDQLNWPKKNKWLKKNSLSFYLFSYCSLSECMTAILVYYIYFSYLTHTQSHKYTNIFQSCVYIVVSSQQNVNITIKLSADPTDKINAQKNYFLLMGRYYRFTLIFSNNICRN